MGAELTEKDWNEIVEWYQETGYLNLYKNYEGTVGFLMAKPFGLSLLRSLDLNPEEILIIKKEK